MEENIVTPTGETFDITPPPIETIESVKTLENAVPVANEPQVAEPVTAPEIQPVEAKAEEAPAVVESEKPAACEVDTMGIMKLIDAHFVGVKNMLKFNKDKDVNVNKLNSDLNKYREGYQFNLFKSLSLNLIGLREDAKKSLRELGSRELSVSDAKKYLGYMTLDYEDFLENLNVRIEGDKIKYNGVDIDAPLKKIVLPEIPEFTHENLPELKSPALPDVTEYLQAVETYIAETIKNNSIIDKILKAYIDQASLYESGIHQVVLYPVIRCIANGYEAIKIAVEQGEGALTEENAKETYANALETLVKLTDEILGRCGVIIDGYVSDVYDPKKHRILKTVKTESDEDNGKIVIKYTDCYTLEDKVIYPQKVDVYKK